MMVTLHLAHAGVTKHTPELLRLSGTLSRPTNFGLIANAEEDPRMQDLRDVLTIVPNTGIRARELRNLRWKDVEGPNGRFFLDTGKTLSSRFNPLG
jgi:integrase